MVEIFLDRHVHKYKRSACNRSYGETMAKYNVKCNFIGLNFNSMTT